MRLVTTPEVIQEFAHIRAQRRSRTDAATSARHLAVALAPLVEVTAADLEGGLDRSRP